MKKILAATLMIMGAIFISAYFVCMAIFRAERIQNMGFSEYILLLISGLAAIIAGAILFYLESGKSNKDDKPSIH